MVTDCPNCSSILTGDFSLESIISCPFCSISFKVCASPFEQLKNFMESGFPAIEYGPFRDYGYPRKNYTGWIIHRLREDNREAVIALMNQFLQDLKRATQYVNTLWDFDFGPYIEATPETIEELRALWLRVRFKTSAEQEGNNISYLCRNALWTKEISLTPDWTEKVLRIFEEMRLQLNPEDQEDVEPVSVQDLKISQPENNPLFDWACQAPIAIRESLAFALRMCNYGPPRDDQFRYGYLFRLDQSQEYRWGADHGYASHYLLESNIFSAPAVEQYQKSFSKAELFAFLDERKISYKQNYTRQRMIDLLLSMPDGDIWLEKKIKDAQIVCLHPTLYEYYDKIRDGVYEKYHLYDAIGMIPVPGIKD